MKKIVIAIIGFVAVLFGADIALAAEGAEGVKESAYGSIALAAIFLSAGLAMGIGAVGPGIGQGTATKGALEGMARNPGMAGKLTTTLLLGLAIMESLAIYALVVALMLLFLYAPQFM
ncbi:MAG: ATP synthase F0 subunit C [Deltaproteobacteria bacterium]|nr:ATP synthase F0 subunit C [Deltaproteobacteria bacterium]